MPWKMRGMNVYINSRDIAQALPISRTNVCYLERCIWMSIMSKLRMNKRKGVGTGIS